MIILTVLAALWMRYSAMGRSFYAVGGNAEASRLSGLSEKHVIMQVFMINGIFVGIASFSLLPDRADWDVERDSFALYPRTLGEWSQSGPRDLLSPSVEENLGADDYHQITLVNENSDQAVGLFMAWYKDQSNGGVHSPEICLPGAGWEIAWLERTDISGDFADVDQFEINRAVIQKGETRMMVYYWFEQRGRRMTNDVSAKVSVLYDSFTIGRSDGAIVRFTTAIGRNETDAQAAARIEALMAKALPSLPRFIPDGPGEAS